MAKYPKWMIYAGGATVVLVAYTLLTSPEEPPRRANNVFRGGATSRTKGNELFRPEDYTAKFPVVNVQPRDAFKPLVAKTTKELTAGNTANAAPNGIPAAFTGGDGNWIYTGNAEVNGVPNALLENTTTGDSVFLRPGERWKSLTLARVTPNLIELIGPTGQRRTVAVADESSDAGAVAAAPAAGGGGAPGTLPPVGPGGGLSGAIGAGPNASVPGAGDNRTNRRERRNRRNNRNNQNNNANPAAPLANP